MHSFACRSLHTDNLAGPCSPKCPSVYQINVLVSLSCPSVAIFACLQEQLSAATAAMVTQGNIEAEAEAERKRAEKEARRKAAEEEEAEEAARLALEAETKLARGGEANGGGGSGSADSPVAQVRAMVEGGSATADVAAFVKQLAVPGGLPGMVP